MEKIYFENKREDANPIRVLFVYPNTFGMNMLPPAIALFNALLKQDGHEVRLFDATYYAIDYGVDSDGSKADNLNVVAYDPYPNEEAAKELGFEYVSFEDLLKQSDIITLHCPYTPETHHMINKKTINLIKKGAFLINTARGQLVETEALIEALDKEILAGAGLDVLEEEGEIKDELHFLTAGHPKSEDIKVMLYDHMLMRMPNVLVTPHNAFNSQEALERILNTTLENIKNYQEGNLDKVNLVPEKS